MNRYTREDTHRASRCASIGNMYRYVSESQTAKQVTRFPTIYFYSSSGRMFVWVFLCTMCMYV